MADDLIIPTTIQDVKISDTVDMKPEHVAIIKSTVAKNTTNLELAYFLNVCKSVDLNPFMKEIWCYKDNKKNLLVFAGRDGFLKAAQKNPYFGGIRSCEIRVNDDFSIDPARKHITHNITTLDVAKRGEIVGAWAMVFRKGGEPTIELVDFKTYCKKFSRPGPWQTHPADMIKKVAETHALKKAMGITGLQCEDDFTIQNGIASAAPALVRFELIDEVKRAREDVDSALSDEDFLKAVCIAELGKGLAVTQAEKEKVRQALFTDNDYDLATGDKIPE